MFVRDSCFTKYLCYRIFKREVKFEHDIDALPNNLMYILCKFICGSHRSPVETGRWHGVARNDRLCHLCGSGDIGDEYHYILSCSSLKLKEINSIGILMEKSQYC